MQQNENHRENGKMKNLWLQFTEFMEFIAMWEVTASFKI